MQFRLTRSEWRWIRIFIYVFIGVRFFEYIPYWNMERADDHARKILPILRADKRFDRVKLHSFTGSFGSLLVSGQVDTDKDRDDLKKLVTMSKPPVRVLYALIVTSDIKEVPITRPNTSPVTSISP
jgi:hypothetical protein